jgi:hypothetical protein
MSAPDQAPALRNLKKALKSGPATGSAVYHLAGLFPATLYIAELDDHPGHVH